MTTAKAPPRIEPARVDRSTRFGLRHLMFAVVLAALLLAAMARFGLLLLIVVLATAPVLGLVAIFVVLLRKRDTERLALLRFLAIAAERGMPLAPGVEACAELCGGGYRRRALVLSRLIESGVPLPAALDAIPGLLPDPAAMMASVGWAEGALAPALREAEATVISRQQYRGAILPKLAYLFGILIALQVIGSFIFYYIMPKFAAIFQDFGISLPVLTIAAIETSNVLFSIGLFPLLILLQLAILGYGVLSYLGFITWQPPPLGWLLRTRDRAAILRTLAVSVEAERPLDSILTNLARVYPRRGIRRRLGDAVNRISSGEPWLAALRREGLINASDIALLEASTRAGNLPWALRTLAELHERRLGYRIAAAIQVLFPVCVLLAAVLVGLFVVSLFLPLIQITTSLA